MYFPGMKVYGIRHQLLVLLKETKRLLNFPIKCAALSLTKLQCATVIFYLYIGAVNKENDGSYPSNISFSTLTTSYRLDFGFVYDGQLSFPGRPIANETIGRLCKKLRFHF